MTRHDFVECNGDNFMLIIPKLTHIVYQHMTLTPDKLDEIILSQWFWLFLAFYVAMTNQVIFGDVSVSIIFSFIFHKEYWFF